MVKKYIASVLINNNLEKIEYETDGNPIDYLWGRYGMDSYIEYIEEVISEETQKETEEKIEEK